MNIYILDINEKQCLAFFVVAVLKMDWDAKLPQVFTHCSWPTRDSSM